MIQARQRPILSDTQSSNGSHCRPAQRRQPIGTERRNDGPHMSHTGDPVPAASSRSQMVRSSDAVLAEHAADAVQAGATRTQAFRRYIKPHSTSPSAVYRRGHGRPVHRDLPNLTGREVPLASLERPLVSQLPHRAPAHHHGRSSCQARARSFSRARRTSTKPHQRHATRFGESLPSDATGGGFGGEMVPRPERHPPR